MPQISTLDLTADYGKFVLEPLERGYGQTIGNGLRRVLLSSIQGAAISAVRIDKVAHEFAPIPGVKEDTTELLLNIRDLAVKINREGPLVEDLTLKLEAKGPGTVTGADVVCPEGVEVVNPEMYIATISDPTATLGIEIYVGVGIGYVLPEKQERYRGMIGVIPCGAQYTPITKVNYTVEQTRLGIRTDYERLVLDVWTNRSIRPNDAISQAAHILDKYFRMFFELGEPGYEAQIGEDELSTDEFLKNVPDIRIEELDFSQRTFNCLRRAGILTLKQLALASESDLTAIRGFGKKSLLEVRDKLQEHGLELRPPKGGFRADLTLDDEDDDF
ncbi:MAG: DNA-directed RNA polymerase subunit alpha [Fimbriimonas sp.]